MSFDPNANLDPSQVSNRRGGSGGGGGGSRGFKIGGGLGGVALLVVVAIVAGPQAALNLLGQGDSSTQQQSQTGTGSNLAEQCRTGADANSKIDCRVVGTVNSLNAFWKTYLPTFGTTYRAPQAALESGTWNTGCGTGSSDMGPFYCPTDETVYIDTTFYSILESQYGSSGGALAQEYVVAHEFGHHIQNLIGTLGHAQQDPKGEKSGGVRVELQADCFAGIWVKHATQTPAGAPLIPSITQTDINDALSAAQSVGDDHIQEMSGRVNPESWTHGSSAQRQKWFMQGYNTGDLAKCDTINAAQL